MTGVSVMGVRPAIVAILCLWSLALAAVCAPSGVAAQAQATPVVGSTPPGQPAPGVEAAAAGDVRVSVSSADGGLLPLTTTVCVDVACVSASEVLGGVAASSFSTVFSGVSPGSHTYAIRSAAPYSEAENVPFEVRGSVTLDITLTRVVTPTPPAGAVVRINVETIDGGPLPMDAVYCFNGACTTVGEILGGVPASTFSMTYREVAPGSYPYSLSNASPYRDRTNLTANVYPSSISLTLTTLLFRLPATATVTPTVTPTATVDTPATATTTTTPTEYPTPSPTERVEPTATSTTPPSPSPTVTATATATVTATPTATPSVPSSPTATPPLTPTPTVTPTSVSTGTTTATLPVATMTATIRPPRPDPGVSATAPATVRTIPASARPTPTDPSVTGLPSTGAGAPSSDGRGPVLLLAALVLGGLSVFAARRRHG